MLNYFDSSEPSFKIFIGSIGTIGINNNYLIGKICGFQTIFNISYFIIGNYKCRDFVFGLMFILL